MNSKKFLNLISKKTLYFFYFFLFSYAIFYAFRLGITSDAGFYIEVGKNRLDYLLSFGFVKEKSHIYQQAFPAIYLTVAAFVSSFFPQSMDLQIFYIFNFTTSLVGALGVYKLSKLLFNEKIAIYTFVFLLLYAPFFGHMHINGRDTSLLACNIWITYFSLKYFDFDILKNKKYVIYLSIIVAIGVGIRLHFVATLIPLILYLSYNLFQVPKKFKIFFFIDFLKIILFSSFIVFVFWSHLHSDFFSHIKEMYLYHSNTLWGWPYAVLNGKFFESTNYPFTYIFEYLFYKTPEYVIFLYICFFFFLRSVINKIKSEIPQFNKKIFFILFNIFYPTMLLFIFDIKIYDGIRLFLYLIPYFLFIPAITFYYLTRNFSKILNKLTLVTCSVLFFYYIYSFSILTPYQYIYANSFAGKFSSLNDKFENDYWGVSLKELMGKIKFSEELNKKKQIKFTVCGPPAAAVKYNINNLTSSINYKIVRPEESPDYVILTNRTLKSLNKDVIHTCFKEYNGKNIVEVKRRNLVISAIKEMN
jgi:hypothetical protein